MVRTALATALVLLVPAGAAAQGPLDERPVPCLPPVTDPRDDASFVSLAPRGPAAPPAHYELTQAFVQREHDADDVVVGIGAARIGGDTPATYRFLFDDATGVSRFAQVTLGGPGGPQGTYGDRDPATVQRGTMPVRVDEGPDGLVSFVLPAEFTDGEETVLDWFITATPSLLGPGEYFDLLDAQGDPVFYDGRACPEPERA